MPLLSCKLCGKVFTSSGGRTCPSCLQRIDDLYPRVREFIRDNPKINFNVETLAEELETDVLDVQTLVDMGYLDRDIGRQADSEAAKRQKLAQEFEKSINQMKGDSASQNSARNAASSYGQQRYGDKINNKRK